MIQQTSLIIICLESLPTLYFKIAKKGRVKVKLLRKLEKASIKAGALKLDEVYLMRCKDLELYPETMQIKTRNLSNSRNLDDFNVIAVNRKLEEIRGERKKALENVAIIKYKSNLF